MSRKVHKSQFSSDTFNHLDLFWPQQRNTTNVKPLIYVCNVRGKPREITFYGQQLYLQDTAFSVPCALHILFYDTLNVAPNTLPTAEILSGNNERALVSMVIYFKK